MKNQQSVANAPRQTEAFPEIRAVPAVRHPAKYTDVLLERIAKLVPPRSRVLDPFAGTGRIHLIEHADTYGVEIEPEWANLHPRTIVGNAKALPFAAGSFDVVATSPCYGNRMADHHEAKDVSRRITYRHSLGRALHPESAGKLQWGEPYREFHRIVWAEVRRVLRPGGLFILNCSDHVRAGEVKRVTAWHIGHLLETMELVAFERITTPRMGFGQNSEKRVNHEVIAVFEVMAL